MTKEPNHRHRASTTPLLPGLARKAAKELERPLKAIVDANRAIDAWFAQNGDPFLATPAAVMSAELPLARQFAASKACRDETIVLLSTYLGLADELERRFASVREREDV